MNAEVSSIPWQPLLTALAAGLAAAGVGALLARFARPDPASERAGRDAQIERIEACLPMIQCAQCGHPGCRPYAEAILDGETDIDRCPPGGAATIERLATLLGRDAPPPLPDAVAAEPPRRVAYVDEADCIGCALCLPACPVDAIVGAHRFMHTVIDADCTGCELCVAPCPVDCISMRPVPATLAEWRRPRPGEARESRAEGA